MATQRQRKAAEKLVENGGNVSKAMRAAGYSKQTAKTPQKLTQSKGWQELMDEYLPDDLILKSLHDDIIAKPKDRKGELELAAKLKGHITKQVKFNGKIKTEKTNPFEGLTPEELRKIASK